ncbi:permease [Brachybacterium endophyticum]|uniref:Permease n=1 Tax=Brachybacterium endophyticum TaxID=2182385 RepID=A0A2U2RL65_9MICO|nr:permease [Brachybacterium endophyticum]PWH06535.1 permease [Brachybacterium endophyticum]
MSVLAAAPLVLRRHGGIATALPIIGFTASTGILATVLGGLGAFLSRAATVGTGSGADGPPTPEASNLSFLVICAIVATVLLVPSAMGLGSAAAKLSLARREKDLAAVRLVGGTSAQVGALAVADVLVQAMLGSVLGIVLHLAVTPALTLLDFGMDRFTIGELVMPLWGYPLLLFATTLLAGISAAIALAGVVISPLGVARESRIVRMSVVRLVVWAGLILAFIGALQFLPMLVGGVENGMVVMIAVSAVLMALVIGSVNIVGPFVVWVIARILAALAPTPALLVGARRLAADPRAGWRSVSGVTFALVVAGFLTLTGMLGEQGDDAAGRALATALDTGGLLTLGIAAVLAAVSTGVTQTARVLDQGRVYRSQHVAGAPVVALQRARIAEIGIPLALAGMIAGVSAAGLVAPVISGGFVLEAVLSYLLAAVGALGLVALSVAASAPLVGRVARAGA